MAKHSDVCWLAARLTFAGLLGLVCQTAFGQQYLFNRADFAAGNGPRSVAAGDFNGDGRPDLAVADTFGDKISVLLGQANGTYGSPVEYSTGTFPSWVATADFNGDGKLDLVTTNENESTVSVLLGNGDGTFQTQQTFATGTAPFSVTTADFNGDGKLDLAVTNLTANTVSILLGNGDGTFQTHQDFATGDFPLSVAAGDFNGDGKPDLAVVNSSSNTVSVLLGNGDGTFQAQQTFPTGASPQSVVAGDFNGDGKLDLAVANFSDNTVSILLGVGNGTFGTQTTLQTDDGPTDLIIGDFNADGKLDLATANTTLGTASVLLGNGNGTFQAWVNYGAGFGPEGLTTGDFNGDGKLDLAIVNNGSDSVTILLGDGDGTFSSKKDHSTGLPATDATPRSVVAGDFNRDGRMDWATGNELNMTASVALGNGDGTFRAQLNFVTGTDPISVAVGDFNNDGFPDLAVADNASNQVSVLLGKGDGTFKAQHAFTVGSTPTSVATADFNGDGILDLAVSNENSDDVSILLGNGDGTFGSQQPTNGNPGARPTCVVIADMNNDGKPDLIVANSLQNSVSILLGKGDGSFQSPQNFGADGGSVSVAIADFNGDGNMDVVVADSLSFQVSVMLGNGDGTLQAPLPLSTLGGPTSVMTGDFNQDGKQDIVAAISNCIKVTCVPSWGGFAILLGNGDGTFQPQLYYSAGRVLAHANRSGNGQFEQALAVADFNGDTIPDMAVVNQGDNTVSVFISNPAIAIYPPTVNFGNQAVGTSSGPQTITVSNPGVVPVSITGVQASGDYSETSSCVTILDAGSNCAISVTFTPLSPGTRAGTISLTDNALGGSQTAGLNGSGTGSGAAATFSPTSLTFPLQLVNTTSTRQNVTLTNGGNQTLTITNVAASANFTETNTCTSVAPGANCTISVTFAPNADGTVNGTLTVSDNAGGSPQTVPLTGTATFVKLSRSTMIFATQAVLTKSKTQTETVTNTSAKTALTINSIGITGAETDDFTQTTTCTSTLPAGASCTIGVTFEPGVAGPRSANVSISDNDRASPQTVPLSGTGTALTFTPPSLIFPITKVGTSSGPLTVIVKNVGTITVTFNPFVITGADPGDFSMTTTCGQNVFAGKSCSFSVTFTPTATGKRTAAVSITDDAGGSPQNIPVSGTGD